jgi:hypothetical protein
VAVLIEGRAHLHPLELVIPDGVLQTVAVSDIAPADGDFAMLAFWVLLVSTKTWRGS